MSFQYYQYNKKLDSEFVTDLRKEINDYFKTKGISKHANLGMVVKTIVMLSLFWIPYSLMVFNVVEGVLLHYALWFVMGIAIAGIGMTVMHDAIHGSYSSIPSVNKFLGNTMNFLGGNSWVWHMQHNVLHHTYPNIDEVDDDIDNPPLLRMSPHQKRYALHQYQHLYVWILYCFATLFWVTSKDYVMLLKYKKRKILKKGEFRRRLLHIVFWKVFYFTYLLITPIYFMNFHWSVILGMFLVMHLVAGISLSLIFQPAHVFQGTDYAEKQEKKLLDRSWYKYQLETTTNFNLPSIVKYFAGGLNYQIEHHLFPYICHVHYQNLSPIVKRITKKHGLPYHNHRSLLQALYFHGKELKILGQPEPDCSYVRDFAPA